MIMRFVVVIECNGIAVLRTNLILRMKPIRRAFSPLALLVNFTQGDALGWDSVRRWRWKARETVCPGWDSARRWR